ncbi:amidohydrolase family protein [Pigmentibacter sp. JX0631]|nr:amidohydrolase family protein [Pigmentibacter sp. JX0631]WGL61555.1 amidohydrolase family protein [Pigmentibacter sp. JX0631]
MFDAHFHIIDKRFPLVPNNGFIPEEFNVSSYLKELKDFKLVGGAVVSGSFQAFDQSYLQDALKILGSNFVGVTQIPADTSEKDILALNAIGIKAVRFNIKRGGSATLKDLVYFSQKVFSLCGWHTEIYIDSKELFSIQQQILQIPKCSIDHLGLSKEGIPVLKKLIEKGVFVKATGFGRLDFDPIPVMQEFISINPNSLMFGTDLPSTRAPKPFTLNDIKIIVDAFEKKVWKNIFYRNAEKFYNLKN